jgi:hypothetical protein
LDGFNLVFGARYMNLKNSIPCISVGKTKSGKTIYAGTNLDDVEDVLNSSLIDFSIEDYFEVYCAFECLVSRALQKTNINNSSVELYSLHSLFIKDTFLSAEQFESLKQENRLVTSMDIAKFGLNFVNIEFR